MTQPAPAWPAPLTDETPLPYAAWRVMNLVNGQRSIPEIARSLDVSFDDVRQALEQAQTWTNRAVHREQTVTENTIETVTQCLMSVVGPMGEFIVDDALDDIGERSTLSSLLANIASQINEPQLHAFVRQLRTKGLA